MIHESFKYVSRGFKSVSKVGISMVFQGNGKKMLKEFQRSFTLHVARCSYPGRSRASY